MNLVHRAVALLGALAIGLAVGLLAGRMAGMPQTGLVLGAFAGVLAWAVRDARRGLRLHRWVVERRDQEAPDGREFWGELGYRTEKLLRDSEARTRQEHERLEQFLSAIEASPNGVVTLDAMGCIEWCNGVAAEHFGLDPRRDRLQRITNLVRAPAFVAYLQSQQFAEPVVFAGPQGRSTLSVLVRRYGDGQCLVLSQDITERERTDAMRRSFVANVSHEIRSPLTVLAGFVETMETLPLSEHERRRVLGLMRQQTDRMQSLVADLLTLARLEGSPRPTGDRWLDVGALLRRAHADAVALSRGRHTIELETREGVELAGSEDELMSAIGNLLNNAVRYTPEGGRIDLLWTMRADGGGDLRVVDNGIGIAREHLPRLTERFYRVDGSRSRDTGGTGLGLSIVKHVIQRHGGEIDIQSELGKGSTCRLGFPALRVRERVDTPVLAASMPT